MGRLSKLYRDEIGDDPRLQEAVFDVSYPTGFLALDFLNGSVVKVKSNGKSYYSVGIVDGSCITYIGRPGCGKTSLAIQQGANIIRPFPNACMFYDDIEGGSNGNRRSILSRFDDNEISDRIIYRNSGITAENFFENIIKIHDLKIENRKDYLYNTGLLDPDGEPIFKYEPTVYVLDSLAMLVPDKLSEEEKLAGQMSASTLAKTNTQIYKRMIPKLKKANIILLVINHINDKIDLNQFAKSRALTGWLKQDETLPGGKAAIYLTNNMFRLEDNTKLKESEGMGVYGMVVDVSIVKSRTNASGRSIPLVFDAFSGFDSELSLLIFLKSVGEVNSKGAYMSMLDYPDMKFTQKGFKDKLSDVEFAQAFTNSCLKRLKELIRTSIFDEEVDNVKKVFDATAAIMSSIAA